MRAKKWYTIIPVLFFWCFILNTCSPFISINVIKSDYTEVNWKENDTILSSSLPDKFYFREYYTKTPQEGKAKIVFQEPCVYQFQMTDGGGHQNSISIWYLDSSGYTHFADKKGEKFIIGFRKGGYRIEFMNQSATPTWAYFVFDKLDMPYETAAYKL